MTLLDVRPTKIVPADSEVGGALEIQAHLSVPSTVKKDVTAALGKGLPTYFDECRDSAPHVRADAD